MTNIGIIAVLLMTINSGLLVFLLLSYRKNKQLMREKDEVLKSVNSSKMEFWSSISHDIRTPMNGVMGITDLLKKTELNKAQTEYLEDLNISSNNLLTAVNSFLDRARLASDNIDLDLVPFSIYDIVYGVAEFVNQEVKEKNIEFLVYIEPGIPTLLLGDPVRLREILQNLVGNSLKYTVKGEIVVSVETVKSSLNDIHLKIKVEDTGLGMSPVKQEALYNTVTKIDQRRFLDYNGPGLSLAVSKRIIELMGGELGFTSEENKGSEFWFTSTLIKTTKKMRYGYNKIGITFSGLKAVVIENHEISRKIIVDYLNTLSVESLVFDSTSSVVEYFDKNNSEHDYDVVLMQRDYKEVTDRLEINRLRNIKALNKSEILLLSASANLYHKDVLRGIGYSGYLNKPIILSHLANEIGAVVPAKYKNEEKPDQNKDSKLSILLVEDNLINEKVATVSLERIGHDVVVAREGKTALAKYRVADFDLILLDIKMPGMDGFEVAEKIRNIEKENPKKSRVRIIALTAEDFEGIRDKSKKSGMDGFLRKPFNFAELNNILIN